MSDSDSNSETISDHGSDLDSDHSSDQSSDFGSVPDSDQSLTSNAIYRQMKRRIGQRCLEWMGSTVNATPAPVYQHNPNVQPMSMERLETLAMDDSYEEVYNIAVSYGPLGTTKIIGWSESDGRVQLVDNSIIQFGNEDLIEDPIEKEMAFRSLDWDYTDTIWPVIAGHWLLETNRHILSTLKQLYKGSGLLVEVKGEKPVKRVYLSFDYFNPTDGKHYYPLKTGTTLKSNLYSYNGILGRDIPLFERMYNRVERILDTHNTQYDVIGLCASGLSSSRVANDVLRSDLNQLRHEVGHQRFTQRVGYLVSKYGLLSVTEDIGGIDRFTALLKDYTFAIVDGIGFFEHQKSDYSTFVGRIDIWRNTTLRDRLECRHYYEPLICVVVEGFNYLNVVMALEELDSCVGNFHRKSHIGSNLCSNLYKDSELMIDWKHFCRDFYLNAPVGTPRVELEPYHRQYMQLNEINDFVPLTLDRIPQLQSQKGWPFVFSLIELDIMSASNDALHEVWSAFAAMDPNHPDGQYMFIKCFSLDFTYYRDNWSLTRFYTNDPFRHLNNRYPCGSVVVNLLTGKHTITTKQFVSEIAMNLLTKERHEFTNMGPLSANRCRIKVENWRLHRYCQVYAQLVEPFCMEERLFDAVSLDNTEPIGDLIPIFCLARKSVFTAHRNRFTDHWYVFLQVFDNDLMFGYVMTLTAHYSPLVLGGVYESFDCETNDVSFGPNFDQSVQQIGIPESIQFMTQTRQQLMEFFQTNTPVGREQRNRYLQQLLATPQQDFDYPTERTRSRFEMIRFHNIRIQ